MDFWRQNGIVSQSSLNQHPFTLIGAGGIGSWAALALTMMGVSDLTVHDPDIVEDHNIPNQLYREKDIGQPKVTALADILLEFTGTVIKTHQQEYPLSAKPEGIVVSGLHDMKPRIAIWREAIRFNPRVKWYIEGRMGAQDGRLYTVTPLNPHYERSLYSDEDATEDPCGARAIGYSGLFVAGLIGSQVRKVVMGELAESEILFDLVSNTLIAPQH